MPDLVDGELRDRWWAQWDKLNAAIEKGSGPEVEHQVEVTLRGVAALEQAAIERGAQPLTGDYIETAMPDGRVLAITRTSWDVAKVKRENRDLVVYSAEEVATLIAGFEEKQKTLTTIKETFPGAVVESVTPKAELELDDEIPF